MGPTKQAGRPGLLRSNGESRIRLRMLIALLLTDGAGFPGTAAAQAKSDTVSLRWAMSSDSVLRAGYEMLLHASGDQRAVAVRHRGEWQLSPEGCDSGLAEAGRCTVVLRQVSDTFTLSFRSPDSAVTCPGPPPSEPMPARLSAARDWDVSLDWHLGQRDPVMATVEMMGFIPVCLPSHPVSVGNDWPVVTTFNHQTPRKQFVDSFVGTARLDSLTGPAGRLLAWPTVRGRSTGRAAAT